MAEPMPTCPMAETCKGMMDRPRPSLVLMHQGMMSPMAGIVSGRLIPRPRS